MRRLAISDIHGCFKTFRKLIEEKIGLNRDDQLYLLGDYIDRGPESLSTLDYILQLQSEGYQVKALRGNHEQYVIENQYSYPNLASWLRRYGSLDLLNGYELKTRVSVMLSQLDFFYELDNCFLVHAGFNFKAVNPFIDYDSMLWMRGALADPTFLGAKKLIHGHTPIKLESIQSRVEMNNRTLNIDAGCAYGRHLCCLNLDSYELIWTENCENAY